MLSGEKDLGSRAKIQPCLCQIRGREQAASPLQPWCFRVVRKIQPGCLAESVEGPPSTRPFPGVLGPHHKAGSQHLA